MFLCRVYDLRTSQYMGSEVNDRMEQEIVTRKGIKLFTLAGLNSHDALALMRVMLVSAFSLNPVSAMTPDLMVVDSSSYFSFFFAVIVTILCISLGYLAVLRREIQELRGERSQRRWHDTLTNVLNLLQKGKEKFQSRKPEKKHAECAEEESLTDDESAHETAQEKYQRYTESGMDEVSEPDLWQLWNHGVPSATAPPEDHRRYCEGHIEQMMRDTNAVLERRMKRLEREYDLALASENNDVDEMHRLDLQITECNGLMYNLG
jgi:hypothetical protein